MAEEISPLEDCGWWMERLRKDAKANRHKALFLADVIKADPASKTHHDEAADKLRRLVAENERLHQINQSHEMKLSVRGYEIQIEDLRLAHAELRERNAELLEALKRIADPRNIHFAGDAQVVARAAIARAEGEQK
jgi:hypothetical protein